MTDKVLCPWCGSEMWYPDSPWERQQPEMGGYMYKMHGKCRHCEAMTPAVYGRTPEEAVNAFFAAALRRYEPPCRPMTIEEIEADIYCYPCWIEDVIDRDPYPEVLDKDSAGYFGKVDAAQHTKIHYFLPDEYGKTWRCWPRKPTEAEREAAGWEDDTDENKT